jgi:hypothetical protein
MSAKITKLTTTPHINGMLDALRGVGALVEKRGKDVAALHPKSKAEILVAKNRGKGLWLVTYPEALLSETRSHETKVTTMVDTKPTLEEAQKLVGGYVEIVDLVDGSQMLVNEEGLLQNQTLNMEASSIAGRHIVGDAIILVGKAKWR